VSSLDSPEAEAGDSNCSEALSLTLGAAARLIFANLKLDVVGALSPSLIFTAFFVHLVGLVMAAAQADQALEAHLDSGRASLSFNQYLSAWPSSKRCSTACYLYNFWVGSV